MHRPPLLRPAAAAALLGGLGLGLAGLGLTGVGAAAAVSPVAPTVTVNPDNVMVNTDTHVVGKHFAPGQTLTVAECAKTSWVAPMDPCVTDNTVTVTTNGNGVFKATMKVELCGAKVRPPTQETCHIGVEMLGVDNGSLRPSAPIVVTFP